MVSASAKDIRVKLREVTAIERRIPPFTFYGRRGRCANASNTAAPNNARIVQMVHGLLDTPRAGSRKNANMSGTGAASTMADDTRSVQRAGRA